MSELPAAGESARFGIAGPAGELEMAVAMPDSGPRAAAVVCHPHPLYGGSLDNKVAYALARVCRDAGMAVARFNFRGVGTSEGSFDDGRGETADALAVADWLTRRVPERALLWLGFSFGAGVALRAAEHRLPRGLVTVALPTRYFDPLPRPDCEWLAVQGETDEIVDANTALQALGALVPAPQVETIHDCGHFFHGRLGELRDRVAPFLERAAA